MPSVDGFLGRECGFLPSVYKHFEAFRLFLVNGISCYVLVLCLAHSVVGLPDYRAGTRGVGNGRRA